MSTEQLGPDLTGTTHVNLKKLANDHFSPEFLLSTAGILMGVARQLEDLNLPVTYQISELDKCVVHYASRELIGDLWEFSLPSLSPFVTVGGRFNLDEAVTRSGRNPSTDLEENFDFGQEFIFDATDTLFQNWVLDLQRRYREDPRDAKPVMFMIYRTHSMLIAGADWSASTIMQDTFTSAGREHFNWLKDFPDLSRQELEEIVSNTFGGQIEDANKLGIKSNSKETVVRNAIRRGEEAYVLDPGTRSIVINPALDEELAREEDFQQLDYYDQTQLLLKCPAKFVTSQLYPGSSMMLQDLVRFRASVFVELYLASHDRR